MTSWRLVSIALATALLSAPIARAQEGPIKVAVCNFVKVLENMEEKKELDKKRTTEQQRIQAEIERRRARVKELQERREALKPDSQPYRETQQELVKEQIDYQVWFEVKKQELTATEKRQLRTLFEKIREGTKEVAEARKIDLVVAEHKPDLVAGERLNLPEYTALIGQTNVLYANEKADITQAVTAAVNKKYHESTSAK